MIFVIVGGSGSGKSAYAEEKARSLKSEDKDLYYIATMKIYDEEGRKKVIRHRILREGKGFLTIEQPQNIQQSIPAVTRDATVLLECMSNLLANEIFSGENSTSPMDTAKKVMDHIKLLAYQTKNLIIVTNNIFEDGVSYEESTMQYVKALGWVNQKLGIWADEVTEVVVGIPICVKGGRRKDG